MPFAFWRTQLQWDKWDTCCGTIQKRPLEVNGRFRFLPTLNPQHLLRNLRIVLKTSRKRQCVSLTQRLLITYRLASRQLPVGRGHRESFARMFAILPRGNGVFFG